jgi:molybdopterin synthase catalytic subunit
MKVTILLFAGPRLASGESQVTLELPDGATVAEAMEHLGERYPALRPMLPTCRPAKNLDFVGPEEVLRDGDRLALIPPVQGGLGELGRDHNLLLLVKEPVATALRRVLGAFPPAPLPGTGAAVDFYGVVRPTEEGQRISGIEYEAYEEMALEQLGRILRDLEATHGLRRWIVVHRIGFVPVNEASLFARFEAAHRGPAFEASQGFVHRLKEDVPIWKHPRFVT